MRLGPVRLTCHPLIAIYPGALGATRTEKGEWGLPRVELMLLHSHFVNVDDNPWGLTPALGLEMLYRDPGPIKGGSPLWDVPARDFPGQPLKPGKIHAEAGDMPATAALAESVGAREDLFLTALAGTPTSQDRASLDVSIYSHYPSGVEVVGRGRALITLVITLVVIVALATFLLKRKEIADEP